MFSSLRLFQNLSCPDQPSCSRVSCLFSHSSDLPPPPSINIIIDEPEPVPSTSRVTLPSLPPTGALRTVPAKRPVMLTPPRPGSSSGLVAGEPPRKIQKITFRKQLAVTDSLHASTGVPILRINAAQSLVPVPVRQTMLKLLYDHFIILYDQVLSHNPTLASEHALRQEDEAYKKSNKLTYRNAVISSIASLKKRVIPTSISHPSVGTEGDLATRAQAQKSLKALRLTRTHLERLLLTIAEMQQWGYITDIPTGPGGIRCNAVGQVMKCERCGQPFTVTAQPSQKECEYHWGKPYNKVLNGEKTRIYTCCSQPIDQGGGCVTGPHVFHDTNPDALHSWHSFSCSRPLALRPTTSDTALDVVALDCEMVYTTGGMRVARVSVVDGSGAQVFDELVRMDDDVVVTDYITRFSGITAEQLAGARLPLASIRKSLDALVSSETIIVGHALDNDLKTLRMIHHRCVDTAVLFPHQAGIPYRRALRDLVREHLGKQIQAGDGSVGHSSVEDSIATLDLVRWYILNKRDQSSNKSSFTKTPGKAGIRNAS